MLKKIVCKKNDALSGVVDSISVLYCILILGVIIIAFIGYSDNNEKKRTLAQITRDAVLEMEISGYLTDALKTELTEELEEYGYFDISFTGSTTAPVGYGEKIVLVINCSVEMNEYRLDLVNGFQGKTTVQLSNKKQSTSKNMIND